MIKHGFTLVELLVVISVMAVVFSFGYANYRSYSRRQQFIGNLRKIEGALRNAQTMASSGNKGSCADPDLSLKGYRFSVDSKSKEYSVKPVCGNDQEGDTVISETLGAEVGEISVTAGNIIDGSGTTTNSILFYVLGRGTDINTGLNPFPIDSFTIKLTQESTTKQGIVKVTPGGEISYEML